MTNESRSESQMLDAHVGDNSLKDYDLYVIRKRKKELELYLLK